MNSKPTITIDKKRDSFNLDEEFIITSHRILEHFNFSDEILDLIHRDIFDSRKNVTLSALELLGKIKNKKSLGYIYRLFKSTDEVIKCAAIRTVGKIQLEESLSVLINLFKTTQNELIRNTILEALIKIAPKDNEVVSILHSYTSSPITRGKSRAFATELLLETGVDIKENINLLLNEAITDVEVMEQLLSIVEKKPDLKVNVFSWLLKNMNKMLPEVKIKIISAASPFTTPDCKKILLDSLKDLNPEVRKVGYKILGKDEAQTPCFESVVDFLTQSLENELELEEEVRSAINRMESCLKNRGVYLGRSLSRIVLGKAQELFNKLKIIENRKVNSSHEIGWLIVHSKEYLEYYADEDLKQAIVHYLKGSGNYTVAELIKMVRNSAIKVEVKHFSGYNALIEIIKNPKRPGIALIARELALAKLGKRKIMYQLMRLLFLTRLFYLYENSNFFYEIFTWAKKQKLFRLAEAALHALEKIDKKQTTNLCQECITLPLESKILAITTTHLLKNLDWTVIKQKVVKLLEKSDETYILLNLIDAISTMPIPLDQELRKSILARFEIENDYESIAKISGLIGEKAGTEILDDLFRLFERVSIDKKKYVLSIIKQIIERNRISKDLGLSEFLYKVLREQEGECKVLASVLLYKVEDDYSIQVIDHLFKSDENKVKLEIIRELKGALRDDFFQILNKIIFEKNPQFQQALRETLLKVDDEAFRTKIAELVLNIRGGSFKKESDLEFEELTEIELSDHKSAYKFEKENIVKTTVMFTDIVGYSQKAQQLTSMELTKMIKEYEGMLIPITSSHYGELIKRMGDGHLLVFDEPLNAVLAGIRVQKSLKRYNSFREEKFKITIRIGIHWGDVVRKGDDIYGNTVNIASRLEKKAEGGTLFISGELYEKVKKYFHIREIGPVKVKGINEPIQVYEAYEISVNLPSEKDPLSRKQIQVEKNKDSEKEKNIKVWNGEKDLNKSLNKNYIKSSENRLSTQNGGQLKQENILDSKKLFINLQKIFSSIDKLCLQAENGEITLPDVRKELAKKWRNIINTHFSNTTH